MNFKTCWILRFITAVVTATSITNRIHAVIANQDLREKTIFLNISVVTQASDHTPVVNAVLNLKVLTT